MVHPLDRNALRIALEGLGCGVGCPGVLGWISMPVGSLGRRLDVVIAGSAIL